MAAAASTGQISQHKEAVASALTTAAALELVTAAASTPALKAGTAAAGVGTRKQHIAAGAKEMLLFGEEWGSGGRWIEPYDEREAQETVEKLWEHWHM